MTVDHTRGDQEPDPRWSLANERTLLAYNRTAMACVVAGLAVAGSRTAADTPVWFAAIGLPLIAVGAVLALGGRSRFLAVHQAMRSGDPLPAPRYATVAASVLAAVAVAALIAAAAQL
ncbi:MAG: DUF202 domain-containing protein [Acidimicrobiales bacterium]